MSNLIALSEAPEITNPLADGIERLLEAAKARFELGVYLLQTLSEEEATHALTLLDRAGEGYTAGIDTLSEERRFFAWAAHRWYHKATGNHAETGTPDGVAKPQVDGNIYDIRKVLAQRSR